MHKALVSNHHMTPENRQLNTQEKTHIPAIQSNKTPKSIFHQKKPQQQNIPLKTPKLQQQKLHPNCHNPQKPAPHLSKLFSTYLTDRAQSP